VWDAYRDDLEVWAAARKEADIALAKKRGETSAGDGRKDLGKGNEMLGISMDDDGGGSEGLWKTGTEFGKDDGAAEDLFKGLPVGITEFMKQEKRLKEKHARQGASSG